MQVLDNSEHRDGLDPRTAAGANYALHAPVRDATQPVGLFNQVSIVVRGNEVQHWLNGVKVVEYELGSEEVAAAGVGEQVQAHARVWPPQHRTHRAAGSRRHGVVSKPQDQAAGPLEQHVAFQQILRETRTEESQP